MARSIDIRTPILNAASSAIFQPVWHKKIQGKAKRTLEISGGTRARAAVPNVLTAPGQAPAATSSAGVVQGHARAAIRALWQHWGRPERLFQGFCRHRGGPEQPFRVQRQHRGDLEQPVRAPWWHHVTPEPPFERSGRPSRLEVANVGRCGVFEPGMAI